MSKKLTKEIINQRLAEQGRGITLIGEYESTRTKTAFGCSENHTWDAKPSNVLMGSDCPHCNRESKKLTKETINARIVDRGITLIGDYKNSATKTAFQCAEGHTWETKPNSIMNGSGCPHCSGLVPLTKSIANERLSDRGITLIGDYKNIRTKTAFQCSEGHKWDATPDSVMNGGNGCPHCAGQAPLNKEIINERIADRGIKLIGEYKNSQAKTAFRCPKGHTWDATPSSVIQGAGCPHCSGQAPLNKETVNERIADRGIKLIGGYKNNHTKAAFQCPEGHTWDAVPKDIVKGSGCPHCAGKAPLTKDIVNERLEKRGITLIGEYKDTKYKTTFQCPEGHKWDATPKDVMHGNGCPHCDKIASDNDTIYIWKAVGCRHHGKQVYKIGITSARLGDERIKFVARVQGIEAEIITMANVSGQATDIERRLHDLGDDPQYAGHGGTEFRALNDFELKLALEIISDAESKGSE